MFLFRRPLYAYRLYAFSRRLAEFRLQSVLKPLPLRFFTQRPHRQNKFTLPEEPEKRLSEFLTRYGVPEQTLAFYLALYSDMTEDDLPDLLFRSALELPDFSREIEEKDRKRAENLLKLFYVLCLHRNKSKKYAEHFERLLDNELDFRLEASLSERLNDFFYEDENIHAIQPNWFATTKDRIVLQETSGLLPFQSSPFPKKTAETLIRAVTLMLFRDGVMIPPVPACLRTDSQGSLYLLRARLPVFLTDREKIFLVSFTEALISGNYPAAEKVLLIHGYATQSVTAQTYLTAWREQAESPLHASEKFEFFLKQFQDPPLFSRYIAFVLKTLENMCRFAFETDIAFEQTVIGYIASALPEEKKLKLKSDATETAERFKQAFSLPFHHLERLAIQSKKPPSFLNDPNKLSEILSRQSVSAEFKQTRHRFGLILLSVAIICTLGIFWLLF